MPRTPSLPEWHDYLARWAPVADRLVAKLRDPSDAYDRQELYQMMLSALAGGHFGLVSNDPDYPEFVPMLSSSLNFAAPVPDFVYTYAPIRGEGTYRIAGHRGTSLFAFVTVSETYFTRTDKPKPGLANYDVDTLTIGADGRPIGLHAVARAREADAPGRQADRRIEGGVATVVPHAEVARP